MHCTGCKRGQNFCKTYPFLMQEIKLGFEVKLRDKLKPRLSKEKGPIIKQCLIKQKTVLYYLECFFWPDLFIWTQAHHRRNRLYGGPGPHPRVCRVCRVQLRHVDRGHHTLQSVHALWKGPAQLWAVRSVPQVPVLHQAVVLFVSPSWYPAGG